MVQYFFRDIFHNLAAAVRGRSLLVHLGAIALTLVVVLLGVDWWFYEVTRSTFFHPLIWIAGIGGFFTPVLIPLTLYVYGEFRSRPILMRMGAAMGQAALLAYLISITYKTFTGRIEPAFLATYPLIDNSRDFNFGFLKHGVFWGWPSSHAAVAFAGAFVVISLTRVRGARVLALTYAVVIAIGAAIGFHWLSDVLAGALIGALVGSIVGQRAKHS